MSPGRKLSLALQEAARRARRVARVTPLELPLQGEAELSTNDPTHPESGGGSVYPPQCAPVL